MFQVHVIIACWLALPHMKIEQLAGSGEGRHAAMLPELPHEVGKLQPAKCPSEMPWACANVQFRSASRSSSIGRSPVFLNVRKPGRENDGRHAGSSAQPPA